eukprot:3012642-Pyramimonas_sp.AAC.1
MLCHWKKSIISKQCSDEGEAHQSRVFRKGKETEDIQACSSQQYVPMENWYRMTCRSRFTARLKVFTDALSDI